MFTYPIISLLIPYLVCAGLTAALIKVLAPAARRVNLVDYPNSRKVHETTVPLIGGIAIFVSLTLSLLLFAEVSFASLRILFFCFAIIVVTGVLDDHRDIPPYAKFLVQILVAFLLVVLDGQTVLDIGDIFDRGVPQGLSFLAIPFSIIAIVAAINAQNLIDGYDGVCGVVTIVSLLGLLTLFLFRVQGDWLAILRHELFILISLGLVSVSTFLIFNLGFFDRSSGRVFLGDAGSMFIGLALSFIIIQFTQFQPLLLKATAAPWILGLPLLDMTNVIWRRIREKRPIFLADQNHLHHVLAKKNIGAPVIILALGGTHAGFVAIGLLGTLLEWPDWILFWSMPIVLILYSITYSHIRRD